MVSRSRWVLRRPNLNDSQAHTHLTHKHPHISAKQKDPVNPRSSISTFQDGREAASVQHSRREGATSTILARSQANAFRRSSRHRDAPWNDASTARHPARLEAPPEGFFFVAAASKPRSFEGGAGRNSRLGEGWAMYLVHTIAAGPLAAAICIGISCLNGRISSTLLYPLSSTWESKEEKSLNARNVGPADGMAALQRTPLRAQVQAS